jgi:hypothetical protein
MLAKRHIRGAEMGGFAVESGVIAAIIGAVGAVGAAAVTAMIAHGTANPSDSNPLSTSIAPSPPQPTTWLTVSRRVAGILLVGAGIGMLSAGAAFVGIDKGTNQGPIIGAIFIGWGSGLLAAGVLTLLYRRLP